MAKLPQSPANQAFGGGWQLDDARLLHLGGAAALVLTDDQDVVVEVHLFPGQTAKLTGPDAGQPEEQQDLTEQGIGMSQEGQELFLR